jgi:hypothetical protein
MFNSHLDMEEVLKSLMFNVYTKPSMSLNHGIQGTPASLLEEEPACGSGKIENSALD